MSLKEQLEADVHDAMRAGDTERRNVLRMLLAAIKQEEIDRQTTLDDEGVLAVLTKQAKQRRESIADYETAGRDEQVAQEKAELAVIEGYLPKQLSREEVKAEAEQTISDLGVTGMDGMGQVMGRLMAKLKGQADGRVVSEVVRELLQERQ